MDTRTLGSTGLDVTEVGLGTWNVGPVWTDASDETCRESIRAALDAGVTLIDTAEVYGDGRAERLIGEVLDEYDRRVYVPTKAKPDADERHSEAGLRESVAGSSDRLGVDSLDLLQLHCPETAAFYEPETFASVPIEDGLAAVADMRRLVPEGATMAQFTLRWILDHDAVSTVIPGLTSPEHVRENAAAADLPPLSHETHGAVRDVYEEHVKASVHHRW
ncbi:hypothetical protein BRC64_05265 [Halobacteriales archaeon QH_10_67_22]|nr:MAG: hypothetical protein BRC64_05265 [Halobacteriales archaeon QH_10_67_22]